MMDIPEMTGLDVAFGNVKHMPKYDTLPDDFRAMRHPACRAVSMWFYKGAESAKNGIKVDGKTYTAKEGVDKTKALAAIKAVLGSFEPKHEHKIAACGFMLHEWFDSVPVNGGDRDAS